MTDSDANNRLQAFAEEVAVLAAEVFQSEGAVTADSTAETVEEWDSLHHLNLVVALETRYGVMLDPLEAAELTSIRGLADAVLERRS